MTDLTYEEAVRLFELTNGSGEFERFEQALANWGREATTEDIVETLRAQGWQDIGSAKVKVAENSAGKINGYVGEFYGNYPSVVDSNVSINGSFKAPINTTAEVIEEREVFTAKVGLRETGNFVINKVAPAVVAAGIGITLGKKIDETLYDLDPDFWNDHDMGSLDPDTWDAITTDEDGFAGRLFDTVFQIDDDGNTQAYLDADAVSYISWWLNDRGALATDTQATYEPTPEQEPRLDKYEQPLRFATVTRATTHNPNTIMGYILTSNYPVPMSNVVANPTPTGAFDGEMIAISDSPFKTGSAWNDTETTNPEPVTDASEYTTLNGTPFYFTRRGYTPSATGGEYGVTNLPYSVVDADTFLQDTDIIEEIGTIFIDGTVINPILQNQEGADLPDTTGWTGLPAVRQSLQNQYPQLWDNAKHQDYVDEDGQNKSITLIPINLPNVRSPYDTQPTSGDRSQDEPLIDPTTATKELIDTITKLISGTPPINPPTTGGGGSPTVVAPTGNASSLWAIYNPTQAQVDAFGAWLWSSNFVDQIKKLFNDPMQAIIGIHKVFATPSIGGTATIKVGYLDSQVPSDYIDDQYTTVNCGTINLDEYFGSVFDYSPYTRVSLYLPFIGIVDLDVSDVMRSSINVTYHVDVLSGACLADVTVTRDLGSAVLYQYSGSAIVTYPVSSGNYMGMVAGVLSVAGGVLGTIASGGALAPALIGGAVGASHLHTNVSHSGGFSGCAGAMAGKIPYLIISRPQTAMADNYGHFTGKPANSHVTLRNCGGMTRVKSVYVGNMNATDEEKDMIEAQLKAGVII